MESANAGAPITFFEATTAAAFKLFADNPADVLLLEVGLGGRLDATNVIDRPACAVITPISIDHVEFLGGTLEAIAHEKAGIFKPGAPTVLSEQGDAVQNVLEREALRTGLSPHVFGQDFLSRREAGRLIYQDEHGLLDLPLPGLAGAHQAINAGAAIAALRLVFPDLPVQAFERGMLSANWPGRLQNLSGGRLAASAPEGAEIWLDGGHNEAGARVLAAAMRERAARAPLPLYLIYGGLKTKDSENFLRHFIGLAEEILAVPIEGEQIARDPHEIVETAKQLGLKARAEASMALALANLVKNYGAPRHAFSSQGRFISSGKFLRPMKPRPTECRACQDVVRFSSSKSRLKLSMSPPKLLICPSNSLRNRSALAG